MTDCPSNIAAFLAGIIFGPPSANTSDRLVAGSDAKKFNRLFDEAIDRLLNRCRDTRGAACPDHHRRVTLPAEALADLMMGLAMQMSLIASHLADCQGWVTDDFEGILQKARSLPPPLNSVFAPDFSFWECLLKHRQAAAFLEAFERFDELHRIRCVAALTSGKEPDADIDAFVAASHKKAFIQNLLLQAGSETGTGNIDDVPRLKQAIAWSIAASADHPTITTTG